MKKVVKHRINWEYINELIKTYGNFRTILTKGGLFGMSALIGNNGKRSGSCVALEDCEILTINRKNYQ